MLGLEHLRVERHRVHDLALGRRRRALLAREDALVRVGDAVRSLLVRECTGMRQTPSRELGRERLIRSATSGLGQSRRELVLAGTVAEILRGQWIMARGALEHEEGRQHRP